MPVIAVAPEEKARSTNSTVSPSIGVDVLVRVGAKPVVKASTRPTAINIAMPSTNAYVGAEKSARPRARRAGCRPAGSRSPQSQRNAGVLRPGMAEVIAATPAEIDTATVRTVDQQAGGRDQRRKLAEVPVGDDVGPPAVGVGHDQLTVGQADRQHQHDNRHRDAEREPQRTAAGEREHGEHRLGPVGDRREGVGGQDRQRDELAHPFVSDRAAVQRRAQHHATPHRCGAPDRERPALACGVATSSAGRRSPRSRPSRNGFDAPPPLSVESGAGPDRPAVRETTLVARPAPAPSARPPRARRRAPPRPNQRPGLRTNVGHLLGGAASPLAAAVFSDL